MAKVIITSTIPIRYPAKKIKLCSKLNRRSEKAVSSKSQRMNKKAIFCSVGHGLGMETRIRVPMRGRIWDNFS